MKERIVRECRAAAMAFASLESMAPEIATAVACCSDALRSGKTIFLCGNGGSAADAQHIAAELVGRYRTERTALKAIALTVDPSVVTSIGNDYGFDHVFSRQLEGLATTGDVMIAISTSGHSRNVLQAIAAAKSLGVKTIGLTGRDSGEMGRMCDILICAPAEDVPRIQELHAAIGHILCGEIEEGVCA